MIHFRSLHKYFLELRVREEPDSFEDDLSDAAESIASSAVLAKADSTHMGAWAACSPQGTSTSAKTQVESSELAQSSDAQAAVPQAQRGAQVAFDTELKPAVPEPPPRARPVFVEVVILSTGLPVANPRLHLRPPPSSIAFCRPVPPASLPSVPWTDRRVATAQGVPRADGPWISALRPSAPMASQLQKRVTWEPSVVSPRRSRGVVTQRPLSRPLAETRTREPEADISPARLYSVAAAAWEALGYLLAI